MLFFRDRSLNLVGKVLSTMDIYIYITVAPLLILSIPGLISPEKMTATKKSGISTCSIDHSTRVGSFTNFTSVANILIMNSPKLIDST